LKICHLPLVRVHPVKYTSSQIVVKCDLLTRSFPRRACARFCACICTCNIQHTTVVSCQSRVSCFCSRRDASRHGGIVLHGCMRFRERCGSMTSRIAEAIIRGLIGSCPTASIPTSRRRLPAAFSFESIEASRMKQRPVVQRARLSK
jgi:hypothetical protein